MGSGGLKERPNGYCTLELSAARHKTLTSNTVDRYGRGGREREEIVGAENEDGCLKMFFP